MDSGVGFPLPVWVGDCRALPGYVQAITRCFPTEGRQFTPVPRMFGTAVAGRLSYSGIVIESAALAAENWLELLRE